jgi:hypothetical protein
MSALTADGCVFVQVSGLCGRIHDAQVAWQLHPYINFLADDDEDRVRAAYGDKYGLLAAIKRKWDPENFFHHNANIRPVAHADA